MVILKITEGHISNVTVDRLDIVVLGFVSLFIIPKYAMFHSTAFQVSFCIYINKRWIRIPAWDFWEKTFAIQPHCCLCSLDVDGSQVMNTNEKVMFETLCRGERYITTLWGDGWRRAKVILRVHEYLIFHFVWSRSVNMMKFPDDCEASNRWRWGLTSPSF